MLKSDNLLWFVRKARNRSGGSLNLTNRLSTDAYGSPLPRLIPIIDVVIIGKNEFIFTVIIGNNGIAIIGNNDVITDVIIGNNGIVIIGNNELIITVIMRNNYVIMM